MSDYLPVVMELETDQEIVILDIPQHAVAQPFSLKNTMVSDLLTVYNPQPSNQDDSFGIFNTLGQEILQFKTSGNTTVSNVAQFAEGLYYISNKTSSQTLKFLKTF